MEGRLNRDVEAIRYSTKEEALQALMEDIDNIDYVARELFIDRDFVLSAVKLVQYPLATFSKEFLSDWEIVFEKAKKDGTVLREAEKFQGDKYIVIEAIKDNDYAVQFASDELVSKKEKKLLREFYYNKRKLQEILPSLDLTNEVVYEAIKSSVIHKIRNHAAEYCQNKHIDYLNGFPFAIESKILKKIKYFEAKINAERARQHRIKSRILERQNSKLKPRNVSEEKIIKEIDKYKI